MNHPEWLQRMKRVVINMKKCSNNEEPDTISHSWPSRGTSRNSRILKKARKQQRTSERIKLNLAG
ncbi:MAG: hypothetical protein ABEJ65_11755 [bacterium]